MTHILLASLLTVFGAGVAMQVVSVTIPTGVARNILMIAIASAAGLFILNRVAYADVTLEPQIRQTTQQQTAP